MASMLRSGDFFGISTKMTSMEQAIQVKQDLTTHEMCGKMDHSDELKTFFDEVF